MLVDFLLWQRNKLRIQIVKQAKDKSHILSVQCGVLEATLHIKGTQVEARSVIWEFNSATY